MYVYIYMLYQYMNMHKYVYIYIYRLIHTLVTICESSWPWLLQALHDRSPSWSHSDLPVVGWLVQMLCWYKVDSKRNTMGPGVCR